MRKYLIPIICFLSLVSCNKEEKVFVEEEQQSPIEKIEETHCVQGVTIVKLSENLSSQIEEELRTTALPTKSSDWASLIEELGVQSFERLFPYDERYEKRQRRDGLHRWYKLTFDEKVSLTKASTDLNSIPGVEIVEPQMKIQTDQFNDQYFPKLWGLYNEGKGGAKKGFDINVAKVWKQYTTGSPKVVVGVIDGGIELDHPDLEGVVIPAGTEGSRNFVDNNFLIDPHDHGTHVAGTIAAKSNNEIGVAGIAGGNHAEGKPGVRLLSCQIFKTEDGLDKGGDGAQAIVWAANHGAVISQNSWGYVVDRNNDGHVSADELAIAKNMTISYAEKEAVDYFIKNAGCDNDGNQLPDSPMKGGIVFFAAGNDNIQYGAPANYEPVIAVGSVDNMGGKSSFSNYGDWVDICAPGSNIYSTVPGGKYSYMSGTSMACPHASGVAALILSYNGGPGYTNEMLKEAILKGADGRKIDASFKIGPMLDALGAITYGSSDQPAQPDFTYKVVSNGVEFKWKHTANKKGIGAYGYRLIATKDKSLLKDLNLNQLPEEVISANVEAPSDQEVGSEMSGKIEGLDFTSEYEVSIIAYGYGCKYTGDPKFVQITTEENHPPVIRWECPENLKIMAFEQYVLNIDASDEDGHKINLTYDRFDNGWIGISADVKNPNHYVLTIDANTFNAGKYEIHFHASDTYGAKTERTLQFEILPNRPPVKLKDFENHMANLIDETFEYKVSDYITDPDLEDLDISYLISNSSLMSAEYNEGILRFKIKKYGYTNVTVTAKDIKGLTISSSFDVLARRKEEYVNLYPNPVVDTLHIRTGEQIEQTQVEIYSASGSIVFKGAQESSAFDPMEIGMTHLAPGRYQVKIAYGGKEEFKTIIKK